jgi:hypothetical protein
MKLAKQITLTAAVLVGAVAGLRAQDQAYQLSNQAVTFALTTKSFVGGTFEVDPDTGKFTKIPAFESLVETLDKDGNIVRSVSTTASKAVTAKLGNAQILAAVIDSLPDGVVSGWSIVVKTDVEGTSGIWAIKKGQEDFDLSEAISVSVPETGAGSYVETYTATYKDGELTKETTSYAASGTTEGLISMELAGANLFGSFVQPYRGVTYNPDSTDKSVVELVYVPGAGRVTGVLGSKEGEEGATTLYGGTVSIAAATGKVVKLEVEM